MRNSFSFFIKIKKTVAIHEKKKKRGHVAGLVRSRVNGLIPFERTKRITTETMLLALKQQEDLLDLKTALLKFNCFLSTTVATQCTFESNP